MAIHLHERASTCTHACALPVTITRGAKMIQNAVRDVASPPSLPTLSRSYCTAILRVRCRSTAAPNAASWRGPSGGPSTAQPRAASVRSCALQAGSSRSRQRVALQGGRQAQAAEGRRASASAGGALPQRRGCLKVGCGSGSTQGVQCAACCMQQAA